MRNLLHQGLVIPGRHSQRRRPLRGGDITILAPRHDQLRDYAAALCAGGLRVRLREEGIGERDHCFALYLQELFALCASIEVVPAPPPGAPLRLV